MSVFRIRAHKRYATRLPVEIGAAGQNPVRGLMIELGLGNCRISCLGDAGFNAGDEVTLRLEGRRYPARIRWAHDGLAGVQLDAAMGLSELAWILSQDRDDLRAYGT